MNSAPIARDIRVRTRIRTLHLTTLAFILHTTHTQIESTDVPTSKIVPGNINSCFYNYLISSLSYYPPHRLFRSFSTHSRAVYFISGPSAWRWRNTTYDIIHNAWARLPAKLSIQNNSMYIKTFRSVEKIPHSRSGVRVCAFVRWRNWFSSSTIFTLIYNSIFSANRFA